MSKFYVGQRVRLARPKHAKNKDRTGAIREFFSERKIGSGDFANCCVDWDDGMRGGIDRDELGVIRYTHTDQLEPLQPERNQTIAWSECVWKPEHMRAEA